ncbi:flavodoxin family protein [Dermatobacter hominis]|uniref:flavodoxin family protein n=1 Tax=Dermatobacter hominis TaxID=2884263 RepID=UPI001D11D362|nr:flavodoxin domain-containing protein [Dermatobacter hominis]UDY36617.1 flavodoxin domain-containing protein [Dermatobacter hominis]
MEIQDRTGQRSAQRALVVYESMYGNTHRIATAIGDGLRDGGVAATVVPVGHDDGPDLAGVDLLVVGGPTHVHGMSRESTRTAAREAAGEHEWLTLDDDADGTGLREWLGGAELAVDAAAFDTRRHMAAVVSGRASKGIAKLLRRHGARLVVDPASFFVTDHDDLEPGEEVRAREWGAALAAAVGGRAAVAG